MASAAGCEILYLMRDELMRDELLASQGEPQGGVTSGPQTFAGLSAYEENSQLRWFFGPHARITSRSLLKGKG